MSTEKLEINVNTEPAGTRLVRLTVEIPEEQVQQEMRRTAKRISRQINIPGFRRGKAPYNVILQRFGEETIRRETADELIEQAYRMALKQEEIIPYAPASLVDSELTPMRFVFTVPLPPVVELGDYRSLRIKPPTVRVSKKEVQEVLERLRVENAVLEPVEDRGAQPGDVVVIDVEGRAEDGQIFLKDAEVQVLLDPESEYPAPGFHQALEGMTVGEERTFRLKMPDGKPSEEAEFTVRLVRLFDRILPEIDDDLARTVGDYDNLKELQKEVKERIRRQKREEAEKEYAEQVLQAVVEQARIEYPPDALEEELDKLVEQFGRQVEREVRMRLADYLRAVGKSEEELREELRPQAEERLKRSLVLAEVVQAEGIEVSDEELEQRIAEISQAWGDEADKVRERLRREDNRRILLNNLLVEKVIDRLTAIARGEKVPDTTEKEG